MNISYLIFILSTISFISCKTNLIDISLSTDYIINTSDTEIYPDGIIPKDSTFYFRLQGNISEVDKVFQLRTLSESKNYFIVKAGYYNEVPPESEIDNDENWTTLSLGNYHYDSINYVSVYYLELPQNIEWILISVTVKSELDYLSIYIRNEEERNLLQYEMNYYDSSEVPVKEYGYQNVIFALRLLEEHIGDAHLTFYAKHREQKLQFAIYAIGLKTGTDKELKEVMSKDNPNFLDIRLNETLDGQVNDVYNYHFKLDENSKYVYIMFQVFENLDYLKVTVTFPRQPFLVYDVTTSKEYEIDIKYLKDNKYTSLQFKSTNYHIGDTYIKLKVKKGVPNKTFRVEGFGDNEYFEEEDRSKPIIEAKFNKTFHSKKYDIHQYYFKAEEKTSFYLLYIFIYDMDIDYLSFKVEYESEKDENEDDGDSSSSAVLIAIIVIICVLIALIILYFVLKKLGIIGKNDIISKDIESSNQIMPNA